MQKVLSATAITALLVGMSLGAQAADLPPVPAPVYKAPPIVPPPLFSWTGVYLGGNLGAAWTNRSVTHILFGVNGSPNNNATFIGGGQVGANYQFGSFVAGVEGDFDWLANNNATSV